MENDLEGPVSENDLVDLDLFDFVDLEEAQSAEAVSVYSKDDFTDEGSTSLQIEDSLDFFPVSDPVKLEGQNQLEKLSSFNYVKLLSPSQSLEMSDHSEVCETEYTSSILLNEEEMGEPNWLSDWDSLY